MRAHLSPSNKDDLNHRDTIEQFTKIAGTKRVYFASDYVLDEVLSFATRKTKNPEVVLKVDSLIHAIEKIFSYDSDFDKLKNIEGFKRIKRVEVL